MLKEEVLGEFNLVVFGVVDVLYAAEEAVLLLEFLCRNFLPEEVRNHMVPFTLFLRQKLTHLFPLLQDNQIEASRLYLYVF